MQYIQQNQNKNKPFKNCHFNGVSENGKNFFPAIFLAILSHSMGIFQKTLELFTITKINSKEKLQPIMYQKIILKKTLNIEHNNRQPNNTNHKQDLQKQTTIKIIQRTQQITCALKFTWRIKMFDAINFIIAHNFMHFTNVSCETFAM